MVNDPIRLPLEEGRAGVDEHRGLLHDRLVAFLWILPGSMEEEAAANRHPDLVVVGPTGDQVQFVSAKENFIAGIKTFDRGKGACIADKNMPQWSHRKLESTSSHSSPICHSMTRLTEVLHRCKISVTCSGEDCTCRLYVCIETTVQSFWIAGSTASAMYHCSLFAAC